MPTRITYGHKRLASNNAEPSPLLFRVISWRPGDKALPVYWLGDIVQRLASPRTFRCPSVLASFCWRCRALINTTRRYATLQLTHQFQTR